MDSSAALTQSMSHITSTKLAALSKQHRAFEAVKQRVLDAAANESRRHEKITILLDAFEKEGISVPPSISIDSLRRFLDQSRHDPSISTSMLQKWQDALQQALDVPSQKYEHALLFGRLVMEWLEHPNDSSGKTLVTPPTEGTADLGNSFEYVGRAEMHEQRKEWEFLVFAETSNADPLAIQAYLESIFGSTSKSKKMTKSPLEELRSGMQSFKLGKLDTEDLKLLIEGILTTDLLSEQKRKALVEFQHSPLVLHEMTDVLNIQLDALESWSWGPEAIPVEIRRALNGKYRVYMDEEILQALLLHFVGMQWGVHVKKILTAFFHSGAWKQSSRNSMDRTAKLRRERFVGSDRRGHSTGRGGRGGGRDRGSREGSRSVRNERRQKYQREFFLAQLPTSFENTSDMYDDTQDEDKDKSPMAIKQSLLQLITTEALVNTRLYGSFTILQSDFRWFGPSLPHATMLTVLKYFGVSPFWLGIFKKFLQAPIKFVQDGPEAQTQIRKSGAPIQHKISDALGETVLFCLDFAVNQSTGANLHRLHDDLWFWGPDNTAVTAWETIQKFSRVMGMTLNEEKTGSVQIRGNASSPSSNGLPEGEVRWGLLTLKSSGQWTIDEKQVDSHIHELRQQLKACKSTLAWVQAWNLYLSRFFSNHFGQLANCLGRPHRDMVLDTFSRIQRQLFSDAHFSGPDVLSHLKNEITTRFALPSPPLDGFFYFPLERGGLGLANPSIPPLLSTDTLYKTPMDRLDHAFELEEETYDAAKTAYDEGHDMSSDHHTSAISTEPFFSLEEYTRYREETSTPLHDAYCDLLAPPPLKAITNTIEEVWSAQSDLRSSGNEEQRMYEDWILQLYGGDVVSKFGGLEMGEKRLLPIGLVSMLRGEKVRWLG